MKLLNIFIVLFLLIFLTAVTQIGGVVFLISLLTFGFIDKRLKRRSTRILAKLLSFSALYLGFLFIVVPLIAKPFGRVPLPVYESGNLKPANIWTCLLNRHYVKPQLRNITNNVATRLNSKYPGVVVNYLDANFPFIDRFPLLPHLSHNDGRKLDLSFQYNDSKTLRMTNDIPSVIGYGICEEPKEREMNTPEYCRKKGYWKYNLLRYMIPQDNKERFTFDNERTKDLVNSFASHNEVGIIFIEPHLKSRLGLTSSKIRFHGCQAVRHDDHIHVQLK